MPETEGSTLGSPTIMTPNLVKAYEQSQEPLADSGYSIVREECTYLPRSEEDIKYIGADTDDQDKALEKHGSRSFESDFDESPVDNWDLMNNPCEMDMEIQRNVPTPICIHVNVKSGHGGRTICPRMNDEFEMSLQVERGREEEGKYLLPTSSGENVETGSLLSR